MTSEEWPWDRRYRERPWISVPDPLLVELAGDLPPGRAVDLGCGPGRHAIWLAQRGFQVLGVDASRVGLDQAAERAAAAGVSIELVLADLRTYQPPRGAFDLVVVANIHPQPNELPPLLARAAAGLAAGGHLFMVGHHLDSLGRDGPPDPALLYTLPKVESALPPGLVVERLERVERPVGDVMDTPDVAVVLWARTAFQAPPEPLA